MEMRDPEEKNSEDWPPWATEGPDRECGWIGTNLRVACGVPLRGIRHRRTIVEDGDGMDSMKRMKTTRHTN